MDNTQIKRRLISIVALGIWAGLMTLFAQDFQVESFDIVPTDLTARTASRVDFNGRKCAVLKVLAADAVTEAEGNVIGELVHKGNMETWIYLTDGTKKINLRFDNHFPLMVCFKDFNYPTVNSEFTYVMRLGETKPMAKESGVERFTVNGVSFDMVKVDGGTFQMGSNQGDSDELPVHSEHVSAFSIGKTEVTQALWRAVMGNNPAKFKGDNLPVENVSWHDCLEFINRLNQLTGRNFRLPTESEWEYAARGGNRTHGFTYCGNNDLGRVAWFNENSGGTTHPVAQKSPNELGLFDMSGNVMEWTADLYSVDYNSPRTGSTRVARGGNWKRTSLICTPSRRRYSSPSNRYDILGLRLAL